MMIKKSKFPIWKKIAIGLLITIITLIIISIIFPLDYYKLGIENYNKKNYREAFRYLNKVDQSNPNYNDAVIKIKELQPKIDSLLKVEEIEEDKKVSKENSNESNNSNKIISEDEYIEYFQAKWDSVKVITEGGIPQYKKYSEELDNIMQEMGNVLQKEDPKVDLINSQKKLNKLRLKFNDSDKNTEALRKYFTYGQPLDFDLKLACEEFLESNANDPSSIDIEDWKIKGQSKNGWLVLMKYRGRNAFGGLILKVSTFDVRYNPTNDRFTAISAK
jgi:hypothetical protein